MSTEELKQKLSVKDSEGNDLFSHLSNVVSKFLLDNPKNCYDILEDYSLNVKTDNYDFKKHSEFSDNAQRIRENNSELKDYTETAKKLLEKLNDGAEEPQDVTSVGYVPNFMEEAKWFEYAGVGFGQEESYRIFKSLTALSNKKQVKQVKLWGKILGSGKDYWVAEGILEGGDDGELPPDVEPKGQKGVNAKNYWVTSDLYGDWTELPIVTPQQIKVSRQLKYVFTGNLNRPVITNPHFDGQEQHLLKCQIVRITHTTSLVPAGLNKVNEEEPREIEDQTQEEGFKYPEFEALQKLNGWAHMSDNILNEGRLVHMPIEIPEGVEEAEEENMKKQVIINDPFEVRLKSLNTDKAPEGYNSAWTIKTYGDSTNYSIYHKEGKQNHGVIAIKSLVWPGQITVYNKQQWQSLYVGYGFKNSNQLYYPSLPEPILEEVVDGEDYPEPNFPPEQEKPEGEEGAANPEEEEN